jgi:crotonobetainyl-CoA:carnitine CoA-transferase CaiB-like acyl-CoA transferase
MYAYSAILTALLMRHRTGDGTSISVSMLEALGEWMGYPLYYAGADDRPPPRSGAQHAAIAPYGPFAGSDGEIVFLGVQNEREWVAFCEQVLGRADLSTDLRFVSNERRVENRQALHAEIDTVLSRLPATEIIDRLERARIANARLNTVGQFAAHPQLASRHRWCTVGSEGGAIRATRPPADIDGLEPRLDPIPSVGEHTGAILTELGYAAETIAEWRSAGIV